MGKQFYNLAKTFGDMSAFMFVFFCTLVHLSCALPRGDFYSYGSSAEDTKLPRSNNAHFNIDLSLPFSFFDGVYTELYVSWVNKIFSAGIGDCANVVIHRLVVTFVSLNINAAIGKIHSTYWMCQKRYIYIFLELRTILSIFSICIITIIVWSNISFCNTNNASLSMASLSYYETIERRLNIMN